jgi:predicted transcriptional regulator
MRFGAENGTVHAASTDACTADQGHELQLEQARLVLLQAAIQGLEDIAAGRVLDEMELDEALSPVEKKS